MARRVACAAPLSHPRGFGICFLYHGLCPLARMDQLFGFDELLGDLYLGLKELQAQVTGRVPPSCEQAALGCDHAFETHINNNERMGSTMDGN